MIIVYCLFFCAMMPYLIKIPLGIAMHHKGGYNNKYPRNQQNQLTGFGARALAAHQNGFEALLLFSASLLAVFLTNHINGTTEIIALSFVGCRFAYTIFYLVNLDRLRTLAWFGSFGCCITLFFQAV